MESDRGSRSLGAWRIFKRVGTISFGFPNYALIGSGLLGVECDAVRNHKCRIKSNSKLSYEFWVVLDFLTHFKEGFCPRVSNRPNIFNRFFTSHPDAVIGNG